MLRILWAVVLCLFIPLGLFAANLKARVNDQDGAALAGVEAKLVETSSGTEKYGVSDKNGEIVFPDLPPGSYKLMGRKAGYANVESAAVSIADSDASLDCKMVATPVLEKMMEKAISSFKKGKYSEAAQAYAELSIHFPLDATVWGNLSRSYQALHQSEKALEAARKAVQLEPTRFASLEKEVIATATYEAGKKQLSERDFDNAIKSFSESTKSDPTYGPAFYGLALAYANKGVYGPALENIQQAIKLEPANQQYKDIEERLKQAASSSRK
jgi:tetratricopeptide (TPR) repeat protein